MDILGDSPELALSDEEWRIYSRHENSAPQYIGKDAVIENSSLTSGCEINGVVRNSVLGNGVRIERDAVVCDSVIFENVTIGKGAIVNYSIIDANVEIGDNSVVGLQKDVAEGVCVISRGVRISKNSFVGDNRIVNEGEC